MTFDIIKSFTNPIAIIRGDFLCQVPLKGQLVNLATLRSKWIGKRGLPL